MFIDFGGFFEVFYVFGIICFDTLIAVFDNQYRNIYKCLCVIFLISGKT